MHSPESQQLTLSLSAKPQFSFDNFLVSPLNHTIVAQLKHFVAQPGEGCCYVYGAKGSGKSHVLQACCQLATQQSINAMYLPLNIVQRYSPSVLDNLEHYQLIAIDDVQVVAGNAAWEEALFHLFNRVMTTGQRLLISGNEAIKTLPIKLPDLTSRLASGLSIRLFALTESEVREVLQQRAQQVGLVMSGGVIEFLLKRLQRDMSTLSDMFAKLDQASLSAKRKLTVPFVKKVLEL